MQGLRNNSDNTLLEVFFSASTKVGGVLVWLESNLDKLGLEEEHSCTVSADECNGKVRFTVSGDEDLKELFLEELTVLEM